VLADDMAADDYLRKNYSVALQHHAKSAQSSTIDPDTQKGFSGSAPHPSR
jgi:hypothetical protein